jgi:hypothetical protein
MPSIVRGNPKPTSVAPSEHRPELVDPAPDRFVRDVETSLCEQLLDIAATQGEAQVEPDGVLDDETREAVATYEGAVIPRCYAAYQSPTTTAYRDDAAQVTIFRYGRLGSSEAEEHGLAPSPTSCLDEWFNNAAYSKSCGTATIFEGRRRTWWDIGDRVTRSGGVARPSPRPRRSHCGPHAQPRSLH